MDWRTIESAPRDRSILVTGGTFQDDNCIGGPYLFGGVAIANWDGDAYGEDHPWQGNPNHSHDEYRRHAPTHWMPLPAPPLPNDEIGNRDAG